MFAGRLIGKALLEGHHIVDSLNDVFLAHLIGAPIARATHLAALDPEVARSLELLEAMDPSQIDAMELTFAADRPRLGGLCETVPLKAGGCDLPVTAGSLAEFLRLRSVADLGGSQAATLGLMVKGFRDVVPESLGLLLETEAEARLALAGAQTVDAAAWKASTILKGVFADEPRHDVVRWFWTYVETADDARRAALLLWATGSGRVPLGGFAALQGRDGQLRPFALTSVPLAQAAFPRAHTCFNRIDVPLFGNEDALVAAFDFALHPSNAAAFSMD